MACDCNGNCKAKNETTGVNFGGRFDLLRAEVLNIVDLLERKNNDYGDSATQTYDEYGDVAYFIRLADKINRLKSLTINNKTQQVNDESVEDTVRDIIGYSLLYLEWKTKNESRILELNN